MERGRHSRFDNVAPFGFGGFLLTSPEVIVVEGQPGENVLPAGALPGEEEASANARSANGENLQDQFLPSGTRLGAAVPVRDAAEYVFVRRDGTLLFGVAYSWDNGTLRYVTREGLRRSVSQDALDMDATQQFNEQRGVNFRTPARLRCRTTRKLRGAAKIARQKKKNRKTDANSISSPAQA